MIQKNSKLTNHEDHLPALPPFPDIFHHNDQCHQEYEKHAVHISPGKVRMHHAEALFIED